MRTSHSRKTQVNVGFHLLQCRFLSYMKFCTMSNDGYFFFVPTIRNYRINAPIPDSFDVFRMHMARYIVR